MPAKTVSSSTTSKKSKIRSKPIKCLPCQSPCDTCIGSRTTCLSCVANYTLRGMACVSNFRFSVNVVFAVEPSVFLSNYYSFLKQVAETLQQ